ncbi:fungal-specific transcription factor domain-containing protein [Suillus clintonianus]|uniref:fungal-specific transcription factor domain-containing protein n=1 Tax=Suillus clintonianus TaxID=1904413 RepID=UPI001B879739|nr:fungal-specific transcription factor domain-containing protein [Suillus clintonianus]KAG2146729.1 fungal-specific transcription factor domain-containing protein [Suillus clintonianus]
MPADTSKNPLNAPRRISRKIANEEETELKRARGEISCAECRRLKLKCDKKVPCGSCVRRGCPTICPNGLVHLLCIQSAFNIIVTSTGSLSTGQGTRFVLADTEHLHRKIMEMGQRIRQLEDALSIFQGGVSVDVHPLLTEDLLSIKFGPEAPKPSNDATNESSNVPINSFGTLTIGDGGESNYFGLSAGSETLFMAGAVLDGTSSSQPDELPSMSADISRLESSLPFSLTGIPDHDRCQSILDSLLSLLPPYPRASTLCETYMEHAAWIFRPIRREELIDDMMSPVYALAQKRQSNPSEFTAECPEHTIAALYMVFAQGALMDLTLPSCNQEAEDYFHLGRVALSLRSVFESPTDQTVQALALMGYCYSNRGKRYALNSAWSAIALASKLAQSMGLHRDPSRFNLSPKVVQRRRTLFWEVFSADLFHSLALGRPPSNRLSYIDCEFPEDETTTMNDKGEVEIGFWRWKHTFTRDVFSQVTELTLSAELPSYDTILELDRKVREQVLPPSLNLYRSSVKDDYTTPSAYIRGRILFQFRTTTMLFIHRSFFAQALLDFPTNPLRSPYAPSFLAAYRCASATIKTTLLNFQMFPELYMRWWPIWSHLLSAAVIVGSIVTRAPSSTMAPAAWEELNLAVEMFSRGSETSSRARHGLAILIALKLKAFQALERYRSGAASNMQGSQSSLLPEVGGDDELTMFGGQTRVLVSKILSQQNRKKVPSRSVTLSAADPSQSTASTPSASDDGNSPSDSIPDVHPMLVEFLQMLPPPSMSDPTIGTGDVSMTFQNQWDAISLPPEFMTPGPAPALYSSVTQTSNSVSAFQNPLPQSHLFDPTSIRPDADLADLGLYLSGESGIDERWKSFMRDSGIWGGPQGHDLMTDT